MRVLHYAAVGVNCLLLLLATGCTAPPQAFPLPDDFLESANILLSPSPFDSICIEIDSVEGVGASPETVNSLAEFLRDACKKPVTVIAKKPIPAAEVGNMPPQFIAIMNMQGPPEAQQGHVTAYVYALIYHATARWKYRGHVRRDYPCSMFVDATMAPQSMIRFALKHEAGHMMTIGCNPLHGDKTHCADKRCLMNEAYSISRVCLGFQHDRLCDACQQDLLELRGRAQPSRLTFKGPFIVRQEEGYFVAKLPGAVYLELGDATAFDWQATLGMFRSQLSELQARHPDAYAAVIKDPMEACLWMRKHYVENRQQHLQQQKAIAAAANDIDPFARRMARDLKDKLDSKFGQPTTDPTTQPDPQPAIPGEGGTTTEPPTENAWE